MKDVIRTLSRLLLGLLVVIAASPLWLSPSLVHSQDDSQRLRDLESKIAEYQARIDEAKSKQKTLANTIDVLNNQIFLTTARMTKTKGEIGVLEQEIVDLSQKIYLLENKLQANTAALNERIEATYKRSFMPTALLLLGSPDFSDLFSRMKYLQVVQKNDKEVMFAMEESKITFDRQKELKETKQAELEKLQATLEEQSATLENQKASKQHLLTVTKNDEQKFQQLLSQARSEFEAIQAIIARRGDESKVADVKAGERIASVISGSSCNSSGAHLHFTVANRSGGTLNPFDYLKGIDNQNCSGGGECSAGDPFEPKGSWEWPLSPTIRMNQGYGRTWAVSNTWVGQVYGFHNGIDIIGSSTEVKAVADGTVYRGSYSGGGGCRLRYVRLEHKDGGLDTLYLHVNY